MAFFVIYLFVLIPAAVDAHQFASGNAKPVLTGGRRWYIVLMLFSVGPMALPMLWRSPRFSRAAKGWWTLIVLFIFFVIGVLNLFVLPMIERSMERYGIYL